jgi:hypothetical protein
LAQLGAPTLAAAAGSRAAAAPKVAEPEIKYCSIDDPSCEACQ